MLPVKGCNVAGEGLQCCQWRAEILPVKCCNVAVSRRLGPLRREGSLSCAAPAVTRGLDFCGIIQRTVDPNFFLSFTTSNYC